MIVLLEHIDLLCLYCFSDVLRQFQDFCVRKSCNLASIIIEIILLFQIFPDSFHHQNYAIIIDACLATA